MNPAAIALIALQVSIFLTVFTLGLSTTFGEAMSLWRRPGVLLRSLVSMYIVMPLCAVLIAKVFNLDPAIKIALLVLAVSPVPPILPNRGTKVGAHNSYVFGLLVETAMLSVIVAPLALMLEGRFFDREVHVSEARLALMITKTVLLPLFLGLAVARWWPAVATRIRGPISLVSKLFLVAIGLLLYIAAREEIAAVWTPGTLLALAAFAIVGILAGQSLGRSDRENNTFLAIASGARHPGVALVIAQAIVPDAKPVIAAILLYLLVNVVVGIPYMRWRKRGSPAAPAAGPLPHPSR